MGHEKEAMAAYAEQEASSNSTEEEGNGNEDDDEEDGQGEGEKDGADAAARPKKQELYPKNIYEKMRKFYAEHDPAKLDTIAVGKVEVDEAQLDADLKRRF